MKAPARRRTGAESSAPVEMLALKVTGFGGRAEGISRNLAESASCSPHGKILGRARGRRKSGKEGRGERAESSPS